MIFAPKYNKIPEFYMTFARKIFFRFLGWGHVPSLPPSPTPVVITKCGSSTDYQNIIEPPAPAPFLDFVSHFL